MTLGRPLNETEGYIKACYYGMPGSAKTTHMASLANLGVTVAIDLEQEGWLAGPLRDRGINTDNIIRFTPTTEDEVEQVYWEVKGMFDDGVDVVGVAIDHMTELQEMIVREARERRHQRERKGLMVAGKTAMVDDLEADNSTWDDYGIWTAKARKLMRKFRDLPCHVVYGAHMKDAEKTPELVPALTQKYRLDFLGSCNIIIATVEVANEHSPIGTGLEYLGITKKVQRYVGKDRYGRLPTVLANPSAERVVALTQGKLDLASDPYQRAFEKRLNG